MTPLEAEQAAAEGWEAVASLQYQIARLTKELMGEMHVSRASRQRCGDGRGTLIVEPTTHCRVSVRPLPPLTGSGQCPCQSLGPGVPKANGSLPGVGGASGSAIKGDMR